MRNGVCGGSARGSGSGGSGDGGGGGGSGGDRCDGRAVAL